MTEPTTPPRRDHWYGWVIVVMAALAMVATLPGRTHGLGMITERLLNDPSLGLDRVSFGALNFWATFCGAAFCFPCGWMLDRWGLRVTLTAVTAGLGLVVLAMAAVPAPSVALFGGLLLLTRGLGQSALSVVSISMTGKWFRRHVGLATGIYSFFVSVFFMVAFGVAGGYRDADWRVLWGAMGAVLLFALTPLFAVAVRSPSRQERDVDARAADANSATLGQALRTPAFWIFALATSLYGLISAGSSLFNESILVERGFDSGAYYQLMILSTPFGLAGNLLTGLAALRFRVQPLAGVAMTLLAGSLFFLPFVNTPTLLKVYAGVMGFSGGMITVLFFTVWAKFYGPRSLGRIQGVAQMLTVFASAVGPLLFAVMHDQFKSYLPVIVGLGVVSVVSALGAFLVPTPRLRVTADLPGTPELARA